MFTIFFCCSMIFVVMFVLLIAFVFVFVWQQLKTMLRFSRLPSVAAVCVLRSFTSLPDLKSPCALPTLSFDWKDGCTPVFTPRQMELHYTKHHKAYIDKFNALAPKGQFDNQTVEEIVRALAADPSSKVLFNQAAQHFNHTFFWRCITPNGKKPSPALKAALASEFGSFEVFQQKFEEAGVNNFGSGWTWLVYNPSNGKLEITNSSNAGCPVADGLIPLLTADVWEHAYYKDFENRRADFLKELWKITDWSFVESQLIAAKK